MEKWRTAKKMDGLQQPKQKRRSLNLAEKLAVIEQYEKTGNCREIAQYFGCSCQTIQNIWKHKTEYLEDWANNADLRRVRYRPNSRIRALHFIVYEWVQRCRSYPIRISDQLIRQTGEDVAYMLGIPEIRQMTGWVTRFKIKYNLSNYDLMNTERYEAVHCSRGQKKSLDVSSIIQEVKDRYGNVVPDSIQIQFYPEYAEYSVTANGNKRLRIERREPDFYSSPTYNSYSEEPVETIDLTEESIASESDCRSSEDDVVLVPMSSSDEEHFHKIRSAS